VYPHFARNPQSACHPQRHLEAVSDAPRGDKPFRDQAQQSSQQQDYQIEDDAQELLSVDREAELRQEANEMKHEIAEIDRTIPDKNSSPVVDEAQVRREADRVKSQMAEIEKAVPYQQRVWTKSVLELYEYYKVTTEVNLTLAIKAYEKFDAEYTQRTAPNGRGRDPGNHDIAAELANAWEEAAEKYATSKLLSPKLICY
jgi:hypothetical protein